MSTRAPAAVGMRLDEVDTPALILDLDAFESNLQMLAQAVKGRVRVRAHAKTHKCPEIGKRQVAAGAVGVCCQKVSEAEAMVEGGIADVLISNEVVGTTKLDRLAALAKRAHLGVCVDHADNVREVQAAMQRAGAKIDVYIELEVGMRRCGVAAGGPALALVRVILACPNLRFTGMHAYHGRAQHIRSIEERRAVIRNASLLVQNTRTLLTSEGIDCPIVTGAGSGTFMFEVELGAWDEIQPGSYVFMDWDYARNEWAAPLPRFEHSLFVLATVMSRPSPNLAVVDAGLKASSVDSGMPAVWERPGLTYTHASDEHGWVEVAQGTAAPALGEKMLLVPGHCDPTVNLYDWYVCVRAGVVEALWPITARGSLVLKQSSYGWVVVLCAFTLMFVGFGAAYSFAAFFRAFQAEFGASRAHVSLVFSLCAFLYFLLGAPGGMLADRYGTRLVALVGVAFLCAGLVAAAYAPSVEVLYATYSIGLGIGIGLTYVPSVGAVQPWFEKHRVLASGLAVSGIGAGNLLAPPLAAWWIEAFGWRGAYLALAACTLVLGGAAAAAIRNRPAGQARTQEGVTLRDAVRTRNFWVLYVTLVLSGFGCFVPLVHLGPYAVDAGHPESFGVLLVSLIGLGSLVGRFAIGGIADRIGRMRSLALLYLGMALMLLLWWGSTGAIALSIMAVGFGISYGGFVATFPSVVMDLFGARSVSSIIGCIYTAAGIGTLFGPPVAGAAYDASGSYAAPILGAAALALIAAIACAALLRPRAA